MSFSNGTVVINTTGSCGFSDSRFHKFANFTEIGGCEEIVSISDNFIVANSGNTSCLYKRTSITEYEKVCSIGEQADYCDHTLSEVAFCNSSPFIFDIRKQERYSIINAAGRDDAIKGLYFIYGDLYIVRETAIYKYTPQS